jgi:hypothetical protein
MRKKKKLENTVFEISCNEITIEIHSATVAKKGDYPGPHQIGWGPGVPFFITSHQKLSCRRCGFFFVIVATWIAIVARDGADGCSYHPELRRILA